MQKREPEPTPRLCVPAGERGLHTQELDVPLTKLQSGHDMPLLGFGTFDLPAEGAVDAVQTALDVGYRVTRFLLRHRDTLHQPSKILLRDRLKPVIPSVIPPCLRHLQRHS